MFPSVVSAVAWGWGRSCVKHVYDVLVAGVIGSPTPTISTVRVVSGIDDSRDVVSEGECATPLFGVNTY